MDNSSSQKEKVAGIIIGDVTGRNVNLTTNWVSWASVQMEQIFAVVGQARTGNWALKFNHNGALSSDSNGISQNKQWS